MIGEIFRERDRAFEPGDNPLSAIQSRYAAALGTGKNPLTALADKYNSVMSPGRVPANIRGPGGSANPIRRGVPKNGDRYSPWEDGMFSFSPLAAKPGQTIRPSENAKGELSARVVGSGARPPAAKAPQYKVTPVNPPAVPQVYAPDKNGVMTNIPSVDKIQFTPEARKQLADAKTSVWTAGQSGGGKVLPVPNRQMGVTKTAPAGGGSPAGATVTPPPGSVITVTKDKTAAYPWAPAARAAGDDLAAGIKHDLKPYVYESQRSRVAVNRDALARRSEGIFGPGLDTVNASANRTQERLQRELKPAPSVTPESMGLKPFNSTPTTAAANTAALNAHMNAKRGIAVKPALSASAPPKIDPGPSLDIPSIGSTLSAFKQRPMQVAKPAPVPRVPGAPRV